MRRINFAFAAVFALVFAAAAGGFHLLHVVQYGRIADSLRWQAERARDDDRTDEAIRYANQYLEFRPSDVGVMADLAEWLLRRAEKNPTWKHYQSALNLYDRILRLTPDDRATRRKAADVARRLGLWAEAIDNFAILLQSEGGADLFEN